jgi:hypothetical protein
MEESSPVPDNVMGMREGMQKKLAALREQESLLWEQVQREAGKATQKTINNKPVPVALDSSYIIAEQQWHVRMDELAKIQDEIRRVERILESLDQNKKAEG